MKPLLIAVPALLYVALIGAASAAAGDFAVTGARVHTMTEMGTLERGEASRDEVAEITVRLGLSE